MTAPTRRQLIAGSLAAVGAAGAPIAIAANPDDRVRAAQQEVRDAVLARWPDAEIRESDWLLDDDPKLTPAFMIVVHRKRP